MTDKKEYTAAEFETIEFDSADVITTSGGGDQTGHYTTPRITVSFF